jgi:hypothetical protein
MKPEVGGKRLKARPVPAPAPATMHFIASVRRMMRSGVVTFSGKVWMHSRVVFQTDEFESKQKVQGEIAEWIARQGKRHCIEWLYI